MDTGYATKEDVKTIVETAIVGLADAIKDLSTHMEERFNQIEARLDEHDQRFAQVDKHFEDGARSMRQLERHIDQRFDDMNRRIIDISYQQSKLTQAIYDVEAEQRAQHKDVADSPFAATAQFMQKKLDASKQH